MLFYALTSELFSKNSPTVLYGNACDKIKTSSRVCMGLLNFMYNAIEPSLQVATYLQGPLSFHNNPPSATRPRHRNRHVSSQIFVDSTGREHMLLNFYVQGKPLGSTSALNKDPSGSYFEAVMHWMGNKRSTLSELTLDEAVAWTKDQVSDAWGRSKEVFRYLSGAPLPPLSLPDSPHVDIKESKKTESSGWSMFGLFSGLRGKRPGPPEMSPKRADGEMWTDGEVHADLVRVCSSLTSWM